MPPSLQWLIDAAEELEAVIDSEDVTCVDSFIRGRGAVSVEIQEAAVGTDSNETDQ